METTCESNEHPYRPIVVMAIINSSYTNHKIYTYKYIEAKMMGDLNEYILYKLPIHPQQYSYINLVDYSKQYS